MPIKMIYRSNNSIPYHHYIHVYITRIYNEQRIETWSHESHEIMFITRWTHIHYISKDISYFPRIELLYVHVLICALYYISINELTPLVKTYAHYDTMYMCNKYALFW